MKILIVEDNPRLSARMQQQLQKWYVVEVARSGDEALERTAKQAFDAILLDLGLPDIPGLEVCRQIRLVNTHTPILIVSGLDTPTSKVELLESGADDYITKPFDPPELRARINALQRRALRNPSVSLLTIGDLVLNPASRQVTRAGQPITLRRKEYDILEYLVRHPDHVMSREMIVHHAWPITTTTWTGSVDVHIKQLRDKVDRPFSYPLIKTSYGVGYMVVTPLDTKLLERSAP